MVKGLGKHKQCIYVLMAALRAKILVYEQH
jgi:hypothetical protein